MEKINITAEQISAIYKEVKRRHRLDISEAYDAGTLTAEGIIDDYDSLMQGVYATLMAISSDWRETVRLLDEEEQSHADKIIASRKGFSTTEGVD